MSKEFPSKSALRDQKRREYAERQEIEDRARWDQQKRKDALTMYSRIEECKDILDVKEVLHRLANGERE